MPKTSRSMKAWEHFYPEGQGDAKEGYCLHHIDPSWRTEDPERYKQWNPEDLVMLTNEEHARLHATGRKQTEEAKIKLRNKRMGEDNPFFGKHHTEETREKMSEAQKNLPDEIKEKMREIHKKQKTFLGKKHTEETKAKMSEARRKRTGFKWFNNGIVSIQAYECPEGFVEGRIYHRKKRVA